MQPCYSEVSRNEKILCYTIGHATVPRVSRCRGQQREEIDAQQLVTEFAVILDNTNSQMKLLLAIV